MKYATLALLGTTSAAPGPLPGATYPNYATPYTLLAGDLDSDNIKAAVF